ncbi:MAG: hypothetical protein KKB70_03370 [Proteobacteria bacterium]|nr:hypothetical protein [Pseudomonadota bacterium]
MKRLRRLTLVMAFGLVLTLSSALPATARTYTITDLGILVGTDSLAVGINGSGQIVGGADNATPVSRATEFTSSGPVDHTLPGYTSGMLTSINDLGISAGYSVSSSGSNTAYTLNTATGSLPPLSSLGGSFSRAFDINQSGQIVGFSTTSGSDIPLPTIWNSSAPALLDTSGYVAGTAVSINSNGQTVGRLMQSPNDWHATIWQNGTASLLSGVGSFQSESRDINDPGQVVGNADFNNDGFFEPFLWENGTVTRLDEPTNPIGSAEAINNTGMIVGYGVVGGGEAHAFVYDPATGTAQDMNSLIAPGSPLAMLFAAFDINDSGQIVGMGMTAGGDYHAFLATPTPLPAAFWLLAPGLSGIFVLRRRTIRE